MSLILIGVILLGLGFDFMNGIHDSSNVVATMISSRAFSPRVALGVTAIAEFSGPFIFGVAVANTIGNEVVASKSINTVVILAALSSAILWDLLTLYLGFPSSSSHALVGGIIGAVVMNAGWQAIKWNGLGKVLIALFASPIIGFVFGLILLRLILILSRNATPRINSWFKRGQIVTGILLALSHGANDAQKTMGIITLALVTGGYLKVFAVPVWVILICATMIALGTAIGGWRLIRTLGAKMYKIRPVDGFASQLASAVVILSAGSCHRLAFNHTGFCPACVRYVLDDKPIHPIIESPFSLEHFPSSPGW
jgi:PiT family inorganic phosphate transporter